jgi:Flp pilus assembly protein TadD
MAAAVVAVASIVYLRWQPRGQPAPAPPSDPRLAYQGPYRNIHPDTKYVGTSACVECHVEIALSFARHPMGRSLFPMREALASQPPLDKARFEALGRRLWASREGDKVYHHVAMYNGQELLYEQQFEAKWVVGSGTHGFSYLDEDQGFVIQTPISYYTINNMWGLSPGFEAGTIHGRPVIGLCLQCHANGLKIVPEVSNKFAPGVFDGHAIGCERCHGPGEPHVRERERGDPVEALYDTSTVNPARLPWRERDGVCMQCHLQGRVRVLRAGRGLMDFRPGLPYEQFFNVFVAENAGQEGKTVGHFEEMRRSKCFQSTTGNGKLGCVSCHDPHYRPGEKDRVAFFRERCVRCHEGASKPSCKESLERRRRVAPGDSCIDCHMPPRQAKDVVHAALSDHRVPLRPGDPSRPLPGPPPQGPLQSYFAGPGTEEDPQQRRDLGLALSQDFASMPGKPMEEALQALDLLKEAAGRDLNDLDAWAALGGMYRLLGDHQPAKDSYHHVLKLHPENMSALFAMGRILDNQPAEALPYLQQGVKAYPRNPLFRTLLTSAFSRLGNHRAAEAEARQWVKLEPGEPEARFTLCEALASQGKVDEARKELSILLKMRPPRVREYEDWARRALGK